MAALRKENPRAGKRRPIEKDEDEEDTKKGDANALNGEEKGDGEGKQNQAQGALVVKNTAIPQVQNILQTHSVSLQQTKNGMLGGGRKPEDGKEETQRKKEVVYHVNSLLLNNNEVRDIKGLYSVLREYVLFEPDRLQWLNLSYNYLVKIDADILDFANLKSLQLQGNYINDLEEVVKLSNLSQLQSLTLNGNPIEEIKGYRLYVLGIMFK